MEAKPDLKSMPFKKKAEYIWEYYKLHILLTIGILAVASALIYHYATLKDNVLHIIMINAHMPYGIDPPGIHDFFELEELDEKKQEITVDASFTYTLTDTSYVADIYDEQSLALQLTIGEADIFFAPWQVYDSYALSGCLLDLTTVLTEEELAAYADLLVYTTNGETNESYPCGIRLTDNAWLINNGYTEEPCNFGIVINSETEDIALDFFRYVLNYK